MKIRNTNYLIKRLDNFQIIIFDLDDTIYQQSDYDSAALKSVSIFLTKIIKIKQNIIFKELRKIKPLKRGKTPNLIFNKYLQKKIKDKEKLLDTINKSVKLFQCYDCKELRYSKSLYNLLKLIYKKKDIFLVTNGNVKRQKNKIHYLNISKFFNKIFILDGVKKQLKQNTKNVQYLIKFLKKNSSKKSVFIGDNNNSDKKFAQNLNIDFINFEF